jgi:hypothetical protein
VAPIEKLDKTGTLRTIFETRNTNIERTNEIEQTIISNTIQENSTKKFSVESDQSESQKYVRKRTWSKFWHIFEFGLLTFKK